MKNLTYRGRTVQVTSFDGERDDLATAGLGSDGLASATAPGFADPLAPTPQELRRRTIYQNYRGLTDTSPGGGFGRFFGPGVPLKPGQPAPPEKIAGQEFHCLGDGNVSMVCQLPDHFDPQRAGLVLVPSSASRGVYGGVAVGEWALKKGYAVVYTDKGGGTGFHNLDTDQVVLPDGTVTTAEGADGRATFVAPDCPDDLAAYKEKYPHRFATKHAHVATHIEADWGQHVLESARFAMAIFEQVFDGEVTRENTRVIASGVSNGGGASLRAAEQDTEGLIDAVAVAEPNVTPHHDGRFAIREGDGPVLTQHSQTLLEYASLSNLLQPVASLAPENADAPLNSAACEERAESLRELGLLDGETPQECGRQAQDILNRSGFSPAQNRLAPFHQALGVPEAMAVNMAYAYGQFLVTDHLADFSSAPIDDDGRPCALPPEAQARLFSDSNGIVPTAGLAVINDGAAQGPIESRRSLSPTTGRADQNLEGALKLRALATGQDPVSGEPLSGPLAEQSARIRTGMEAIKATGDLKGKPTVIVTGRGDAVLSADQASRSYLGKNLVTEGDTSRLCYAEVEHAHHLDILNGVPAIGSHHVPLAPYVIQALNLVDDHLSGGQPLPPSQVVRTQPRGLDGETVPPLEEKHIPPIASQPDPSDRIELQDGLLKIPR